jgi:hypothetical protein
MACGDVALRLPLCLPEHVNRGVGQWTSSFVALLSSIDSKTAFGFGFALSSTTTIRCMPRFQGSRL